MNSLPLPHAPDRLDEDLAAILGLERAAAPAQPARSRIRAIVPVLAGVAVMAVIAVPLWQWARPLPAPPAVARDSPPPVPDFLQPTAASAGAEAPPASANAAVVSEVEPMPTPESSRTAVSRPRTAARTWAARKRTSRSAPPHLQPESSTVALPSDPSSQAPAVTTPTMTQRLPVAPMVIAGTGLADITAPPIVTTNDTALPESGTQADGHATSKRVLNAIDAIRQLRRQ